MRIKGFLVVFLILTPTQISWGYCGHILRIAGLFQNSKLPPVLHDTLNTIENINGLVNFVAYRLKGTDSVQFAFWPMSSNHLFSHRTAPQMIHEMSGGKMEALFGGTFQIQRENTVGTAHMEIMYSLSMAASLQNPTKRDFATTLRGLIEAGLEIADNTSIVAVWPGLGASDSAPKPVQKPYRDWINHL